MNDNAGNRHVIDTVFVISLMLLFILSVLSVIVIGANIYKKNVSKMDMNSSKRIAISYITEKVRQADSGGSIYADELFGKSTLVLHQEINGTLYNTYIYEHDGYLMELFARADLNAFYPQTGQKIMKINSLTITNETDNLIKVSLTLDNGTPESVYIAKRSENPE